MYFCSDKKECKHFFNSFISEQKGYTSYIMRYKYSSSKIKIFELDPREKTSFRRQFVDGDQCGQKKTPIIAQEFSNPRMINSTHFVILTTYMLISSTNPTIVYYHDGHWTVFPLVEHVIFNLYFLYSLLLLETNC